MKNIGHFLRKIQILKFLPLKINNIYVPWLNCPVKPRPKELCNDNKYKFFNLYIIANLQHNAVDFRFFKL